MKKAGVAAVSALFVLLCTGTGLFISKAVSEAETKTKTENTMETRAQQVETKAETGAEAEAETEKKTEKQTEMTQVMTEAETEGKEEVFSIMIDPGHQAPDIDMSAPEPDGPGSSQMKAKATAGTTGTYTGVAEYQLNLDVSLLLEEELKSRGYRVVMTRRDHETAISNSERAKMATEEDCDISIRIHANGSDDPSVKGAVAMTMSPENPYVADLYEESYRLSEDVLNSYCSETGFTNLGIQLTDHMTGINFSEVPVTILELGFMTNREDDESMQNAEMRDLMVKGIADGLDTYFGREGSAKVQQDAAHAGGENEETEAVSGEAVTEYAAEENITDLREDEEFRGIYEQCIAPREAAGETWAVSAMDLSSGQTYAYNSQTVMQSASVVKLFIAGAVYDRVIFPSDESKRVNYTSSYDGEVRELLRAMITVSDNGSANRLVEILGGENFTEGTYVLADFCRENGFYGTSMGRRFMGDASSGDNYVSASDLTRFLAAVYKGTLVNKEASDEILNYMRNQQVTYKIPAGLPQGYSSGNKTGEMPEGYGLGCIENDVAIVFGPQKDYVLCVLSNNLGGRNAEAQDNIRRISQMTAEIIR